MSRYGFLGIAIGLGIGWYDAYFKCHGHLTIGFVIGILVMVMIIIPTQRRRPPTV